MTAQSPDEVQLSEFMASLPRKRMGAAALCRDQAGRLLLVEPVYTDTWMVPGGVVEAGESPHAACRREVAEELGLDRPAGRILSVDWVPSEPGRTEALVIFYDGGVLSDQEIAAITLPADELASFAFVPPGEVEPKVRPALARRIAASLAALDSGTVAALEDGRPVS
ncbi:MAG TPA: NUDIX hydrolase [Streptosporangiaceae bacterium]|nr:NUDIX hydrolase [Streptosporangiaceae bacterium]